MIAIRVLVLEDEDMDTNLFTNGEEKGVNKKGLQHP